MGEDRQVKSKCNKATDVLKYEEEPEGLGAQGGSSQFCLR